MNLVNYVCHPPVYGVLSVELTTYGKAPVEDGALQVTLAETDPLLVWSGKGAPRAEGVEVQAVGESFYRIDLPVGGKSSVVTLSR